MKAVVCVLVLALAGAACQEGPTLFSSPFSREDAREIVARELCPVEPERVLTDLIAAFDSGVWIVYVRASDRITDPADIDGPDDYIARFLLIGGPDPDNTFVTAPDSQAEAYKRQLEAACTGNGE